MAEVETTRTQNGLTIATISLPHMSSVSLGIWVKVGGRHEPDALCGTAHFIEHMLFKGTKKRSALRISQDVEGIGGYLNAFTSEEHTCFYSKARADRFQALWDVLSDMFLNSTFDPDELEKERNVIHEELVMYQDQPHHHVQEVLNETLWPDHPLGRPLTGTESSLKGLSRRKMLSFMDRHYGAETTLIAAAGNITHAEVVKAVSRLAGRFGKSKPRPQLPPLPGQTDPRFRLVTKPVEQTQLAIGFRACSRHHPARHAFRLLSVILGENMSSRLFQVIREDHGLAYSISSSMSHFDDSGVFNISAGLETKNTSRTLALVIKEIEHLKLIPPTRAELRRASDYLIGQLDLSLENTENQMMWVGEQIASYGQVRDPVSIKEDLRRVTPAAVRQAARQFLNASRFSMALVSPMKRLSDLDKLVRGLSA